MAWEVGTEHRYRGRARRNQAQVSKNKNHTKSAEVLIECTAGPMAGQTIRYRGYITGPGGEKSPKNEESTADELRAMGASLARGWDDFTGLGTTDIEFCVLADVNDGKTYFRAAFVRPPMGLNAERKVSGDEVAALGAPPPPKAAKANGAPSQRGDAYEGGGGADEDVAFP